MPKNHSAHELPGKACNSLFPDLGWRVLFLIFHMIAFYNVVLSRENRNTVQHIFKYGCSRLGRAGSLHRETLAPCGLLHVSVLQMQGLFVCWGGVVSWR